MPCLTINTNLVKSVIPKGFVDKIIPVLSTTVGKPAEKFICAITSDVTLFIGGNSSEPAAVATLESIGHLEPHRTKLITKELTAFMEKELGIKPNRFFITYYDLNKTNVGIGGNTVEHP